MEIIPPTIQNGYIAFLDHEYEQTSHNFKLFIPLAEEAIDSIRNEDYEVIRSLHRHS